MSLFQRIIPSLLRRYLGRLRFPALFVLTTVVLLGDLAIPDGLPFADEILLALTSLLLGGLRRTKEEPGRYSETDWRREDEALKQGGDPPPCHQCRRRGFYAPRWADGNRMYRACKFCGLWQDIDKEPHEIIRYECRGSDHRVADWKEPHESWVCPQCGEEFGPSESVLWPEADPSHPWQLAPEAGTQDDFKRFWTAQGSEPPPFGIP